MVNDNPSPCARCGHPAISHAYGSCRECAQQDLSVGNSIAPPAHLFLAHDDATDLEEAARVREVDAAAARDANSRLINDPDSTGR